MSDFWNQRYSAEEYVYGKEPNQFFKSVIDTLPAGKLLVPGAGEGRDAVYAAQRGWSVFAFDQSVMGKQKALRLAAEKNVSIQYENLDAAVFNVPAGSFDAVALIYFHLPPPVRATLHAKAIEVLKPGGVIILEAFNPKQLQNNSGGPKDVAMLITTHSLQKEFESLIIEQNTEAEITLSEGAFHNGKASVVRLLARKPIQ